MRRPDPSRPRRTTVIAKRLAFIEDEHAGMARLWALMTTDMIALRDGQPRQDARIAILAGLAAAVALVLGAEAGLTGVWLLAMEDDDAVDAAGELGAEIVEQLMLGHATPAGEA